MSFLALAVAAATASAAPPQTQTQPSPPVAPKSYTIVLSQAQKDQLITILTKTTLPITWEQLTPLVMTIANQAQAEDAPPPKKP